MIAEEQKKEYNDNGQWNDDNSKSGQSSDEEELNGKDLEIVKTLSDKVDIVTRYADKIRIDDNKKGVKTTKDRANRATVEQVLDPRTMRFLGKIINKGIISKINGCISTGKEANVYHGELEDTQEEYAVKIYKTSILVFKDRERYVDGEFRFRNTKNQSNPRKMVKLWAEKEFRNLKRLYVNNILCPKPIDLSSHVLVMEYLTRGDGQPSPKLKDYHFEDADEIGCFYQQMLVYIRQMYQNCRLVHADLSEYNSIVHNEELYIIDVSQSVEPEHPMALDFLRMDIKNVNDFFFKKGINIYSEKSIFKFATENNFVLGISDNSKLELMRYLEKVPFKKDGDDELQDEIFRSMHLIRSLNHLDERDFREFSEGKLETLNQLTKEHTNRDASKGKAEDSESASEESSDEESDSDETEAPNEWVEKVPIPNRKSLEDKEEKKARKAAAKTSKQEKRKVKMKKHVKKKIINKRKTK